MSAKTLFLMINYLLISLIINGVGAWFCFFNKCAVSAKISAFLSEFGDHFYANEKSSGIENRFSIDKDILGNRPLQLVRFVGQRSHGYTHYDSPNITQLPI